MREVFETIEFYEPSNPLKSYFFDNVTWEQAQGKMREIGIDPATNLTLNFRCYKSEPKIKLEIIVEANGGLNSSVSFIQFKHEVFEGHEQEKQEMRCKLINLIQKIGHCNGRGTLDYTGNFSSKSAAQIINKVASFFKLNQNEVIIKSKGFFLN